MRALGRLCPICDSGLRKVLYRQDFGSSGGKDICSRYDVCSCVACGVVYADGVPSQDQLNVYYEQQSKYEEPDITRELNPFDRNRFRAIADEICMRWKTPDFSVLEIGCSNGGLLFELQSCGIKNLLGVDPSQTCVEYGSRKFDLSLKQGTVFRPGVDGKFDIVIAIGVVEHLVDVKAGLRTLSGLLSERGEVWIEVPDASRFDKYVVTPYQDFSIEHFNFFGPQSIENLLRSSGLVPLETFQAPRQFSATTVMPSVIARGRIGPKQELRRDETTTPAIESYILKCEKMFSQGVDIINRLVDKRAEIAIWGTGTQSRILFQNTRLGQANIKYVIDGNLKMHGREFMGRTVHPPEILRDYSGPVVILSHTFWNEIEGLIRKDLGLQNELVSVYGSLK